MMISVPMVASEGLPGAAVDAHSSGQKGFDAQVIVQGRDGQWRTEWTYGNDPYPPRG